jgi:beta-lactamase class A
MPISTAYFKERRIYIAVLLGILISFLAGFLAKDLLLKKEGQKKQESHESGYRYISPLLECLNSSTTDNKYTEFSNDLEKKIEELKKDGLINYAAIYIRDLNNGPWIGINENEKFSPASLMKVPLLISYLKIADSNPGLLQKELVVDIPQSETLSQNIIPEEIVENGKSYTVEDLLARMIIYSDNLAAGTLLENIDYNSLNKIYNELGINLPENGEEENFMTVRNYASFFRILYNSSYLSREMSEKALYLMTKSTFKNGLIAGVPFGVEVSHKFGERSLPEGKQLHDCGIVYRPDSNYLACIMTRGNDFSKMEKAIKALSENIYNNF